jgi:hypothetical protein
MAPFLECFPARAKFAARDPHRFRVLIVGGRADGEDARLVPEHQLEARARTHALGQRQGLPGGFGDQPIDVHLELIGAEPLVGMTRVAGLELHLEVEVLRLVRRRDELVVVVVLGWGVGICGRDDGVPKGVVDAVSVNLAFSRGGLPSYSGLDADHLLKWLVSLPS